MEVDIPIENIGGEDWDVVETYLKQEGYIEEGETLQRFTVTASPSEGTVIKRIEVF